MGKRSPGLPRAPRDLYPTRDPRAALALAPHIERGTRYIEPCAGDGSLIRLLEPLGLICAGASDIEPQAPGIQRGDALRLRRFPPSADLFITNPPWDRSILHPMIRHLAALAPAWLLFDADWPHTTQAAALLSHCSDIVSIGRLRWIADTDTDGKDNSAWYRFDAAHNGGPRFHGRRA